MDLSSASKFDNVCSYYTNISELTRNEKIIRQLENENVKLKKLLLQNKMNKNFNRGRTYYCKLYRSKMQEEQKVSGELNRNIELLKNLTEQYEQMNREYEYEEKKIREEKEIKERNEQFKLNINRDRRKSNNIQLKNLKLRQQIEKIDDKNKYIEEQIKEKVDLLQKYKLHLSDMKEKQKCLKRTINIKTKQFENMQKAMNAKLMKLYNDQNKDNEHGKVLHKTGDINMCEPEDGEEESCEESKEELEIKQEKDNAMNKINESGQNVDYLEQIASKENHTSKIHINQANPIQINFSTTVTLKDDSDSSYQEDYEEEMKHEQLDKDDNNILLEKSVDDGDGERLRLIMKNDEDFRNKLKNQMELNQTYQNYLKEFSEYIEEEKNFIKYEENIIKNKFNEIKTNLIKKKIKKEKEEEIRCKHEINISNIDETNETLLKFVTRLEDLLKIENDQKVIKFKQEVDIYDVKIRLKRIKNEVIRITDIWKGKQKQDKLIKTSKTSIENLCN